MTKFLFLILISTSTYGNSLSKIKSRFCNCEKPNRELDVEVFHEPYLKDSFILFASHRFEKLISVAKVKLILRYRF